MTSQPAKCDSCQAPILFAVIANQAGRKPSRMPLNADPDPAGNVAVYKDSTGRLVGRVLGKGQRAVPPERTYLPHFATCTHPEAHRRRQRGNWTAAVGDLHRAQRRGRGRRPPEVTGVRVPPPTLPGMGPTL